jgi:hypothetical protein
MGGFEADLCITIPTFLHYKSCSTSAAMASASRPPVGKAATSSSTSAAINIVLPHHRACCACSCECKFCLCRRQIETVDPNREEYGGGGALLDASTNAITQVTSYASTGSMSSARESSDAPDPTSTAPTSFDAIREFHGQQDPAGLAQSKMMHYLTEVDDEHPWESFLEKSVTSDAMDEDAGFFGQAELDGSMQNNAPLSSGAQSILSNFTSSLSQRAPSIEMSDIVRDAGGMFGSRSGPTAEHSYLRLN